MIEEKFTQTGLKITPQRLKVYNAIQTLDHPTADEIFKYLKESIVISLPTVYNNCNRLYEWGLIKKIGLRYDIGEDHYHILCTECEKLFDFYYPSFEFIEGVARNVTGINVIKHQLILHGVCQACEFKKNT